MRDAASFDATPFDAASSDAAPPDAGTTTDAGRDAGQPPGDSGMEPCDTPGTFESEPCGMCGNHERFCTAERVWEYGACEDESGECLPGTRGMLACGMCGSQSVRCTDACVWDATSECIGEGECAPGTSTRSSAGCPDGQTRALECSDACVFVPVGSCVPDFCPTPGALESVPCGSCGTGERFCNAANTWEYGACMGEGTCMPGTTGTVSCGMCGTQPIRCDVACTWESAGACTGEGVCSPGAVRTTSTGCGLGEARVLECDSACAFTIEAQPCTQTCTAPADCASRVCVDGFCRPPTCTDGIANGLESDVDCGGSSPCPRCLDGHLCPNGPSDCASALCVRGRCGDEHGHIVLIGHNYLSTNAGADRVLGNAVLLTTETGTIEILVYDQYADTTSGTGEVTRLEASITSEMARVGRTASLRRLSDSTALASALTPSVDVLVLPEQERGGSIMPSIAAAWEPTLRTFIGAGGVVIVSTFSYEGWRLVDRPTLIDITSIRLVLSGTALSLAPGASSDPIAAGVSPYPAPSQSSAYTDVLPGDATSLTTIMVTPDAFADPVVVHAAF